MWRRSAGQAWPCSLLRPNAHTPVLLSPAWPRLGTRTRPAWSWASDGADGHCPASRGPWSLTATASGEGGSPATETMRGVLRHRAHRLRRPRDRAALACGARRSESHRPGSTYGRRRSRRFDSLRSPGSWRSTRHRQPEPDRRSSGSTATPGCRPRRITAARSDQRLLGHRARGSPRGSPGRRPAASGS